MTTVQLGAHQVPLRPPPSFALGRAAVVLMSTNSLLGLGAALGLCWGGKPLKASLRAYSHSMGDYGAAVVDELHALGIPEADIWTAASTAVAILTGAQPTEAGVAAAESFTGATTASSTP